jgi:hypothetical protein
MIQNLGKRRRDPTALVLTQQEEYRRKCVETLDAFQQKRHVDPGWQNDLILTNRNGGIVQKQ